MPHNLEEKKHLANLLRTISGKDSFAGTCAYFATAYPAKTAAVATATFFLSLVEGLSVAAILPLLTVGLSPDSLKELPFIENVSEVFEFLGISVSFYGFLFVFVGLLVVRTFVSTIFGIYVDYSVDQIARDFRSNAAKALQKSQWGYFIKKPTGFLVNFVGYEAERAASSFSTFQKVITALVMSGGYLFLGVMYSWPAFFAVSLFGLVSYILFRPFIRKVYKAGTGQYKHQRSLTSEISQAAAVFKAFKAMQCLQSLFSAIEFHNQAISKALRMRVVNSRLLTACQELLMLGVILLGLLFGKELLALDLSEMGFLGLILFRAFSNMNVLYKKYQNLVPLQHALSRFVLTLGNINERKEVWLGDAEVPLRTSIVFDRVSFSYNANVILDQVDFKFEDKKFSILLGPSGSGKTTIVDLLCGFYVPDSGRILVDGVCLENINLATWRSEIGYVPQDPVLLNDTIFQNVSCFDSNVDRASVTQALKSVGIYDLIATLPQGMDTEVGERGGCFSGGERQRIAIARALVKQPKLLILDEVTASVDKESEKIILNTLESLKGKVTIVAISHQPAMREIADSQITMKVAPNIGEAVC